MIPKVIHYCWFSGEKKNRFTRNCIKSWRKAMPDYKIKCWDANSFDFDSVPFVKQAFEAKKWAFVADYIRIYALYTEGGIYLDGDVKTFKPFDIFLDNELFIGTEPIPPTVEVESAIMGSVKGHPYLKECLEFYKKINLWSENGKIYATCPKIMTSILKKYGYVNEDKEQKLVNGVHVYPRTYFGHCWGTKPGDYYAIHYFDGAWLERKRGFLFKFCKANDLMDLYLKIANFTQKFKKQKIRIKR